MTRRMPYAVLLLAAALSAPGAAQSDAVPGAPVIPPKAAAPSLMADFEFLVAFALANRDVRAQAVCGVPEAFWTAYRGHLEDLSRAGEALKGRYPAPWPQFHKDRAPRLAELERQGSVQLPALTAARAQCRYAAEGLGRSEEGRAALERSGSSFAGRPPEAGSLDRTFDGSRGRAGPGAAPAGSEREASSGGLGLTAPAEGQAQGGLRVNDVPLDSFEALTDGIVFSGARGDRAREVLGAALRHLYSVPAGQEVLRDVQRMRARMGAEFAADKPRIEAELAAASADLARAEAEGKPERSAALREKVRVLREVEVPSRSGDAKPLVPVSFESTPNMSGFSQQDFQVWRFEGLENPVHVSRVVLDPAVLEDANAPRAVDKLLSHELRHAADAGRLASARERGLQWLLVEDRAFLQEARAVLEQKEAMASEPPSAFVTAMADGDATPILRDPVSAREHLFAQPNYLWHVTPADFADPDGALRARLAGAYRMLAGSPKGALALTVRTLERPGPGLGEAFRRARAEAKKETPSFDEQARFIELAAQSWAGKNWLERVGHLGEDFRADTPEGRRLRSEYEEMEREYFAGLGRVSGGGAGR
ncbi:hypothetical protein EPO15_08155 [bacterium]|nr:MAG: hypothetical protein EPO15_08155 [bacterium]